MLTKIHEQKSKNGQIKCNNKIKSLSTCRRCKYFDCISDDSLYVLCNNNPERIIPTFDIPINIREG